jgi:hypothetical protein
MKILVFKLGILRNDAHSQFIYVFDNLLKEFSAAMAIVATLYIEFIRLFAIEESLVDAAVGSDITRLLAEADQRIDRAVVGINSTVNAGLHHFDSKMVVSWEHGSPMKRSDWGYTGARIAALQITSL